MIRNKSIMSTGADVDKGKSPDVETPPSANDTTETTTASGATRQMPSDSFYTHYISETLKSEENIRTSYVQAILYILVNHFKNQYPQTSGQLASLLRHIEVGDNLNPINDERWTRVWNEHQQ